MKEWKVLLRGEIWSDRFNSEELARDHVDMCVDNDVGEYGEFEVLEMTQEDMDEYN